MAIVHFTLATRDLSRAVQFFESTLGWRRINRPGNIAVPAAWLKIAPGQEVHLLEDSDFAPSPFERENGRHIAVTFPCAGFADLQARLEEHGAEIMPAERPTPFARFFFRDPNGYVFEVIEEERTPEVE